MAEREGIENLEYLADPEALERAREATEKFYTQEFELESARRLPPEMQPGGKYALFSDLGRSFPDLEYHTYGMVPGKYRKEFEALAETRKKAGRSKSGRPYEFGRAEMDRTMPRVRSLSDHDPMLGFFLPPGLDVGYLPDRFGLSYGSYVKGPGGSMGMSRPDLIGEEFFEGTPYTETPYKDILREGKTAPGFLSGPTPGSISLERRPDLYGGMPEELYPNVLSHEQFHAGVAHPRFDEFRLSNFFKNLSEEAQNRVYQVRANQHSFLYPIDRYEEMYRELTEPTFEGKSTTETILDQAENLLKDVKFQELNDGKAYEALEQMLLAQKQGRDPVDVLTKHRMEKEDVQKLFIIEDVTSNFREYLNMTSDLKTGEKRGNLYYPPQAKPTKP
jgi:hypothetical protein